MTYRMQSFPHQTTAVVQAQPGAFAPRPRWAPSA